MFFHLELIVLDSCIENVGHVNPIICPQNIISPFFLRSNNRHSQSWPFIGY